MLLQIYNGPRPTTSSQVAVTTGTSIKTLLQVKPAAAVKFKIVEWGISFDGSAAATPIKVELCETDVAATVTAHVAAGLHKLGDPNDPDPTTSGAAVEVGTTATGYTASGEGTTTDMRMFDCQFIAPTNQYVKQFPLGREPIINAAKFARIRVTAPAAVNAICYMTVERL